MNRLWTGSTQPLTPLSAAFFLRELDPPPVPEGTPEAVRIVQTVTRGLPGLARSRTFYFNGAGPARTFATSAAEALEEYWTYQPYKAIAMANDGSGRWTSGFAYGYRSSDEAAERALQSCRAAAERREIDAPCRLMAIDGEPVEP